MVAQDAELKLAESIREACIQAATEGYQDAAVAGLCNEGAFEAAISAIQMLDLDAAVTQCKGKQS